MCIHSKILTENLQGEFIEGGTKTHFEIGDVVCYIKATSSGKKKTGFLYQLFINDNEISPCTEADCS